MNSAVLGLSWKKTAFAIQLSMIAVLAPVENPVQAGQGLSPSKGRLVLAAPLRFLNLPQAPTEDDFPVHNPDKVALGKLLFFDKILSGNRNISCASCHHPLAYTSDGLSLPVGEGGRGLGVTRDTGSGSDAVPERVPRNSPHVFNLGAFEFTRMFHDGRVEEDPDEPSGFRTPAGADFPAGLDNALAAQAMFPVTSTTEMAGQEGENEIGSIANSGRVVGVWEKLAQRLRDIPEYVELFKAAYPGEVNNASDITFVQAANAIGAFEDVAFRAINSPFDRFRRGDWRAMSYNARRGMRLFYGKAGCADCHSGPFQTDQAFYAVCMPQIGPGKGDGTDGHGDFGRERVTGDENDRYKFRTPSLRNVALTGPWGHDGAYNTLEGVVRHMLDPVTQMENYETAQAVLPPDPVLDAEDFQHHNNPANAAALAAASEIVPVTLSDREVALLVDFLHALTDHASLDLRNTVPSRVPSGLTLAE